MFFLYKNCLYSFVFISFLSCSILNTTRSTDSGYFEGVITYSIEYIQTKEEYNTKDLEYRLGDKEVLYFKEGSYCKKRFSKDGSLLHTSFFNLSELKTHFRSIDTDTVIWFDCSVQDSKSHFKRVQDSVVLGYSTICLELETEVGGFGEWTPIVKSKYHYGKELKINPDWYINYLEANFNEIVKIAPGMLLNATSDDFFWISKKSALKVERRKVNSQDLIFNIKKDEVLKEL